MIATIGKEIQLRNHELEESSIASIYFGGGTPSLLTNEELSFLLLQVAQYYSIDADAEITLEANPDDCSIEQLSMWKKAGINRLSIGLQSFKTSDLKWMNRAHTVEEALTCVQRAKSTGFEAISVDLIYGLPDLTLEEWKHHIDEVIAMDVQHISAYCLTVEEKTALNKLVNEKKIVPAGEDAQSEQFLELSQRLKKAGFLHYEISNFGKPGHEAVHNSNYWKGVSYVGVGPSAHSFTGSKRRWNVSNNTKYLQQFDSNAYYEEELLTSKDQWNEIIMTGLRTTSGVAIEHLTALFPFDEAFHQTLLSFQKDGLLEFSNNHLSLTDKGRLQADYIASEFFKL